MLAGNWRWVLVVSAVVFLVGCGGGQEKSSSADNEANKLLVIGIDSADWRLLKPMIEEGRLPVLSKFMTESTHGRMKTFFPLEKSPLLWASICTGVQPDVHGVSNFVRGSDQKPVTGSAWFAPALWDILGAADRSTSLVGMWTTFPARPINGVMVSDYVPYGSSRNKPLAGLCYPDSLADMVVSLRVSPDDITDEQLSYFIPADQLAMAKEKFPTEVAKLAGVLAADLTYLAINRELAKGDNFDLFFFYLRGPDMISHYFYKFMEPDKGHYRHTPESLAAFSDVVKKYYDWSDEVVGEVLGWFPSDRQTVVVSDHGFYGPRKSSERGAAEHSEWGIFLVRSEMYEAGKSFSHLELLDICPTFLALMGLPPAKDMPGYILDAGLTVEGRKRVSGMEEHRVESYMPLRPAVGPEGERDEGVDEEIRKQLRSLGYIN